MDVERSGFRVSRAAAAGAVVLSLLMMAMPAFSVAQQAQETSSASPPKAIVKVINGAECELTATFFGDGFGDSGKKLKLKTGKSKNLKLAEMGGSYTWIATGACCRVGRGTLDAPLKKKGNAPMVLGCVPSLAAPLGVTSPDFVDGGTLPTVYSCDGANSSPPLAIRNVPAGTMSFVLVLDDPDAPGGFLHWVLYDIPPGQATLPAGFVPGDYGVSGVNGAAQTGYLGACAPSGDAPHRYIFKLYALDVATLNLPEGSSLAAVEQAMKGSVIEESQIVALFVRQ